MREIQEGTVRDLQEVYNMMLEDFPEEERKDIAQLKKAMDKKKYKLYLLKSCKSEEIKGYAFVYKTENPKCLWLDYLAIKKSHRGKGYGKKIFKEILGMDKGCVGMLVEVEKANSKDTIELEIQKKRIKFYEMLGAHKLDFEYRLPTLDGSIPLDLYFKPNDSINGIKGKDIKNIIEDTFKFIHDDIPEAGDIYRGFKDEIKDEKF